MKLPTCACIWFIVIMCGIFKVHADADEVKEMLSKKCIEVSGEEAGKKAYKNIEAGFRTLTKCMTNIVNLVVLSIEIQEASPRGELDVVFNKYCAKRSNAIECFDVFTAKLLPCLDKDEQESQDVIKRIVQSLLNFVCSEDGGLLAHFIAEEGPECLESQGDNIQQCMNSTFSTYLNSSDLQDNNEIKTIPKLVVGEKQCNEIRTLESCIVRHLEHCENTTPANIIESMFDYVGKQLCRNYQPLTGNSANISVSSNSIFSLFTYSQMILIFIKLCYFK